MRFASSPTLRIAGLLAGYVVVCWLTRLVFITLVTYFYLQNHSPLQDVGDVVRANQVLIYGLAAAFFVAALQMLYPLTSTRWNDVVPQKELKPSYVPGLTTGAVVAAALLLGTSLGGYYTFLGFYIKFDEVLPSFLSILFFCASLLSFTLVEEFIFRGRLEPLLDRVLARDQIPARFRKPLVLACAAALYVIVKDLQFGLEPLEAVNMALFSLALSKVKQETGSSLASGGFAAGFLICAHAFCSLPLFGQDVAGLILVRAPEDKGFSALLSGGSQGPENGLVLSVLLGIYVMQRKLRLKGLHLPRA